MSNSEFYLGCDASKGYSDFVILDEKEKIIEKVFQLDDTFEGHNELAEFLSRFFQSHANAVVHVGIESTGGYENNWFGLFLRLKEMFNLKVTRLNPLCVKKHHEATLRRNVTDDISAYNIASYLIAYHNKVSYEQDTAFSSTRKQWKFTRLLLKQKTQLVNQMGFLIYQSHPELVRHCKDGVPQWIIKLLFKYPTAKKLAGAKTAMVAKIPYISIEKADQLIKDAQRSVASSIDETDSFVIKEIARQIETISNTIESQKEHMEQNCTMPEVQILSTIKGVGIYSAIGLMINIITIKRFSSVKKLAAYFGLHPVYKQSGDGTWDFRMSKQGRSEPRAILYMTVLSSVAFNPVIKKLYEKCIANKMEKMEAMGVCMHKMLRIIYGMLRTNKAFDPQVDENNSKSSVNNAAVRHQERKRRLQPHDQKAPISRRQIKMRGKQKGGKVEPQKNDILKNGVIPSIPIIKNNPGHVSCKNVIKDLEHIGGMLEDELKELKEICYK